ncbi:reverse transcriptase domain-containing protein [Tanacetum coccineum]
MGDIDINTLTIEQHLALTRRDRPGVVIPELGNDVDFEIKSQFMSELRCKLFAGTDDEDAHEHVQRVLEIMDLFHIPGVIRDAIILRVFPTTLTGVARRWKNMLPAGSISTWDLLEEAFIRKYCPPLKTLKKLEEIRNFKQGVDETLYQAWERYDDLLFKCPQHDLNNHQKVRIFIKKDKIEAKRTKPNTRMKEREKPRPEKEQEELASQSFTPYWKFPIINDDDDEYTIQYRKYLENLSNAITPDLPTEEPDNSLSIGDEHLSTIPETESDKLIKSSVENLVPIPSEAGGIFDNMCDVPFCDENHFDAESDVMESLLNQYTSIVYSPKINSLLEEFAGELAPIPPGIHEADFDLEEDISLIEQLLYDDYALSDDDTFYSEDIDYVEASPPDSELVILEEVKDLDTKDGEIDTDILLTIKDDILRKKLRNNNLLIAKIKSLNDNPTPNFVLKSSSSFPIPVKDIDFFSEKTETFLYLPKLENFRFDIEEKISGSTTVHADISLSEYDSFHFEIEPDQGELTRVVVEDIFDNSSRELYVHVPNVLPNLPTLEDRHYLFLTYVILFFLPYFTYPVDSPFLLSSGSEDTIFDPGISAFHFYSLKPAASHWNGTFICFNDYPDFEDSRAHGFVHSYPQLHLGNPIS